MHATFAGLGAGRPQINWSFAPYSGRSANKRGKLERTRRGDRFGFEVDGWI